MHWTSSRRGSLRIDLNRPEFNDLQLDCSTGPDMIHAVFVALRKLARQVQQRQSLLDGAGADQTRAERDGNSACPCFSSHRA